MPAEGPQFLYVNIGDSLIGEKPLNVMLKRDNQDVIIGDFFQNRVFNMHNHGSNKFSFELFGCQLFIGFELATKMLILQSTMILWRVDAIGIGNEFEIHQMIENSDHVLEKHRWEMNNDQFGSPIILSTNLVSTPPKQKWKFVQVRTIDV